MKHTKKGSRQRRLLSLSKNFYRRSLGLVRAARPVAIRNDRCFNVETKRSRASRNIASALLYPTCIMSSRPGWDTVPAPRVQPVTTRFSDAGAYQIYRTKSTEKREKSEHDWPAAKGQTRCPSRILRRGRSPIGTLREDCIKTR